MRFSIYSCTKAVMAGAVWKVLADGLLARDTRVADVVPEFGANDKGAVTVEHLLTHTGGFPSAPFDPLEWDDVDRRLERFASWRLDAEPGSRFTYHGTSAHWVLAHLVATVTGRDHRRYLREEVLDPLGLPALTIGTPLDEQADVLDAVEVGEAPDSDEIAALGDATGLDVSAIGSATSQLLRQNDPQVRAAGSPGGAGIGRAGDLAIYYQALLANPGEMWDPELLALGTSEILCRGTDPMTGVPANRSLGLIVAGDDGLAVMRGFAPSASPHAFGHLGAGGQVAWADPATGVSFAYVTNGLDRDTFRMGARGLTLSSLVADVVVPD